MPRCDTSPEAVARACAEMVCEMLRPDEQPTPEHVERAALAIIRADRARTRRIVRRERAKYTGPDHMVSGQVACDRILAALKEATR